MKMADIHPQLHTIALSLSPNIGAVTMKNLRDHFNEDLDAVLAAPRRELMKVAGVGERIAGEIAAIDLDRLALEVTAWGERGIEILLRDDGGYPAPLAEDDDSPPVLYTSRALPDEAWANPVAIVGTRVPSREARYLTLELALKLARAGRTVVSGLALGIDAAAHSGALAAGGLTVAALGSGILNVYPGANRSLAERIRTTGALVSEVHPRWGANAQRLVSRNRIISGLSHAVIVVESQADGGAMYCARFAAEQGRPVYTFDLPASGNQRLIKGGAGVLRRDDPLRDLAARAT